jgi:hypothetical protein
VAFKSIVPTNKSALLSTFDKTYYATFKSTIDAAFYAAFISTYYAAK